MAAAVGCGVGGVGGVGGGGVVEAAGVKCRKRFGCCWSKTLRGSGGPLILKNGNGILK